MNDLTLTWHDYATTWAVETRRDATSMYSLMVYATVDRKTGTSRSRWTLNISHFPSDPEDERSSDRIADGSDFATPYDAMLAAEAAWRTHAAPSDTP